MTMNSKPCTGMPRGIRSEAGFSLIELVVVLVLMSVILGLAAPRLSDVYQSQRLNGAARQLSYYLAYVRDSATNLGAPCRIEIDAGWSRLSALQAEPPDPKPSDADGNGGVEAKAEVTFIRLEGVGASYSFAEGVTLERIELNNKPMAKDAAAVLDLAPFAVASEARFYLVDSKDNRAKVLMESGGGRVSIEE